MSETSERDLNTKLTGIFTCITKMKKQEEDDDDNNDLTTLGNHKPKHKQNLNTFSTTSLDPIILMQKKLALNN